MKIEIACRFTGKILFSHDSENNSTRITVEAAVNARANLAGANLAGAYLASAYLARANLTDANLAGGESLIGERPIFQIGPIGSRCAYFVAYITNNGIRVRAGCFFGSIEEFEGKLGDTHGENNHAKEYQAALQLVRAHAEIWTPEDSEK